MVSLKDYLKKYLPNYAIDAANILSDGYIKELEQHMTKIDGKHCDPATLIRVLKFLKGEI